MDRQHIVILKNIPSLLSITASWTESDVEIIEVLFWAREGDFLSADTKSPETTIIERATAETAANTSSISPLLSQDGESKSCSVETIVSWLTSKVYSRHLNVRHRTKSVRQWSRIFFVVFVVPRSHKAQWRDSLDFYCSFEVLSSSKNYCPRQQ